MLVGNVRPWVPGQRVRLTVSRNDRRLRSTRARINRARNSRRGRFVLFFRVATPGPLTIDARHRATSRQRAFADRLRVTIR